MSQPDPYQEKVDGIIAGLREFADWLNEHRHDGLELPAYPDMLWSTQFAADREAAFTEVAAALGIEVEDTGTQLWADRQFGVDQERGFKIHAYHIKPKPADEQPQDWYFTWGAGQTLPDGSDADNRYTIIAGTYAEARAEMLARFGNTWCDQYPNHEAAGVDQYRLKRVMPLAWPKRFQADGVTPLAEQVDSGDQR